MGIGRAWYWTYHFPKGLLKRSLKRHPLLQMGDHLACRQMERAAEALPPLNRESSELSIHFLTGKKYWYQTCFCAYSLMSQLSRVPKLCLLDDGSLAESHIEVFERLFPTCEVYRKDAVIEHLEAKLPEEKYPTLRARRLQYPHLRKLTDIHVMSSGWKLVLDSDMLFFRQPAELLAWMKLPSGPFVLCDVETSYGYSSELMHRLAGKTVPEKLNVGICGLNSDALDWDMLEYWTAEMMREEGPQYTQEQALVALICAHHSPTVAAPEDYLVLPLKDEVISPSAILHHYVAESKPWYFRYGWKHVLPKSLQEKDS